MQTKSGNICDLLMLSNGSKAGKIRPEVVYCKEIFCVDLFPSHDHRGGHVQ